MDQAVSGASNVLITVLAARVLGTASFGLFGIVFLVYVVVIGAFRALICEPLLVHPVEVRERPGDAIGAAGVVGLGLGAVIALTGVVVTLWNGDAGTALLVLGIFLPLLTLQDAGRYLAFALHRPANALVLDVVWLVVLLAAVGVLSATDRHGLTWFIVGWAASGAVAGVLVLCQHRRARVHLQVVWVRQTWGFSWRYLVSYTASQGAALLASLALGAIAGARALGAVNGALLLIRPFVMFQAASVAAGTAEISRSPRDNGSLLRHAWRNSGLTVGVAAVNAVVLLVLPARIGRLVLGETWDAAHPLLLAAAVQILFIALTAGVRSSMLGSRAIDKTVKIEVVSMVVLLVLVMAGAVRDGAEGALWGVALGHAFVAAIWWGVFAVHLRQLRAQDDGARIADPPGEAAADFLG